MPPGFINWAPTDPIGVNSVQAVSARPEWGEMAISVQSGAFMKTAFIRLIRDEN